MSTPSTPPPPTRRVIVCDYNAPLLAVTGTLRMDGYAVFEAYDWEAAVQLSHYLPDIALLVLDTGGTGAVAPDVVQWVREACPGLPVLHIGQRIPGMPGDVLTLSESFTPDELLVAVRSLVPAGGG
jgi:response regulator RpfG family c-di-GMP phosphodiesterase